MNQTRITADGAPRPVRSLRSEVAKFAASEQGATMAEYALMVALVGVFCIGAARLVGVNVLSLFDTASSLIP